MLSFRRSVLFFYTYCLDFLVKMKKVGLIADTHKILHPRIWEVFRHVDHIIHAGDVGDWDIIVSLEALAPVTAVYGNCDGFGLRHRLKSREILHWDNYMIEITHIPLQEDYQYIRGQAGDIKIFGHTHESVVLTVGEVLVINPGSAIRPRGQDHPTVALLYLNESQPPHVEIKHLR